MSLEISNTRQSTIENIPPEPPEASLIKTGIESGKYCLDPYSYRRRQTRVVMVGDVGVGGNNPIRVQSMTTTTTLDTKATVAQAIKLVEAGCEIVRITTPGVADARNLEIIRRELGLAGIHVPLVADIHFNPGAAMEAAKWADKVRINPGNFADAKKFAVKEYGDDEYARELERLEEKYKPLVMRCKELGRAIRIGTNHGSLSDRIMNRFGDSPEGMVESAIEFLVIGERYGFKDVILSMKASNPKVMIEAYRLLAARLAILNMDYPFHLGVTEAGNGEDGRIKSAIGIGALLEDGIGDTIRVSLTEDPEFEIPVAYALANRYTPHSPRSTPPLQETIMVATAATLPDHRDPFHYRARTTREMTVGRSRFGGEAPTAVVVSFDSSIPADEVAKAVVLSVRPVGKRGLKPEVIRLEIETSADLAWVRQVREALDNKILPLPLLLDVSAGIVDAELLAAAHQVPVDGILLNINEGTAPSAITTALTAVKAERLPLWLIATENAPDHNALAAAHSFPQVAFLLDTYVQALALGLPPTIVLGLFTTDLSYGVRAMRLLASRMTEEGFDNPLFLFGPPAGPDVQDNMLGNAIGIGALLIDGIGNVVEANSGNGYSGDLHLAFNILQAAGARSFKTDYIACPSCGRTLFDLQSTTESIKAKTNHLVGVKIAVMGCIVNGLGELADADFGYMGGAPGMINLFVGKECVEKGVPSGEAVDRLITLIKAHGRWSEPGDGADTLGPSATS